MTEILRCIKSCHALSAESVIPMNGLGSALALRNSCTRSWRALRAGARYQLIWVGEIPISYMESVDLLYIRSCGWHVVLAKPVVFLARRMMFNNNRIAWNQAFFRYFRIQCCARGLVKREYSSSSPSCSFSLSARNGSVCVALLSSILSGLECLFWNWKVRCNRLKSQRWPRTVDNERCANYYQILSDGIKITYSIMNIQFRSAVNVFP